MPLSPSLTPFADDERLGAVYPGSESGHAFIAIRRNDDWYGEGRNDPDPRDAPANAFESERPAGAEGVYPGSESGTCFHSNRTCRLSPAHQGMKIGCIGWWESSSVIATTHTSPLDSRFRGNDDLGGRNDECEGIPTDAGMTRPTVVTANIHPGSESGTCFHSNRSYRLAPAHQGMKMDALVDRRVRCRLCPPPRP